MDSYGLQMPSGDVDASATWIAHLWQCGHVEAGDLGVAAGPKQCEPLG